MYELMLYHQSPLSRGIAGLGRLVFFRASGL